MYFNFSFYGFNLLFQTTTLIKLNLFKTLLLQHNIINHTYILVYEQ